MEFPKIGQSLILSTLVSSNEKKLLQSISHILYMVAS